MPQTKTVQRQLSLLPEVEDFLSREQLLLFIDESMYRHGKQTRLRRLW